MHHFFLSHYFEEQYEAAKDFICWLTLSNKSLLTYLVFVIIMFIVGAFNLIAFNKAILLFLLINPVFAAMFLVLCLRIYFAFLSMIKRRPVH